MIASWSGGRSCLGVWLTPLPFFLTSISRSELRDGGSHVVLPGELFVPGRVIGREVGDGHIHPPEQFGGPGELMAVHVRLAVGPGPLGRRRGTCGFACLGVAEGEPEQGREGGARAGAVGRVAPPSCLGSASWPRCGTWPGRVRSRVRTRSPPAGVRESRSPAAHADGFVKARRRLSPLALLQPPGAAQANGDRGWLTRFLPSAARRAPPWRGALPCKVPSRNWKKREVNIQRFRDDKPSATSSRPIGSRSCQVASRLGPPTYTRNWSAEK